jgi:hypothetical protein
MCNPDTVVMAIERGNTEAPLNSTVSCALCAPGVNNDVDCNNPVDPFCPCPGP